MNSGTVGPIGDLVGDLLRQDLAAGEVRDHLGAEPARQAIETDQRNLRTADPGWREFRPEGDDGQERKARHPLDDPVEQLARGGIGPMRVLDHQQDRLTRRQPLDLRYQRPNVFSLRFCGVRSSAA